MQVYREQLTLYFFQTIRHTYITKMYLPIHQFLLPSQEEPTLDEIEELEDDDSLE